MKYNLVWAISVFAFSLICCLNTSKAELSLASPFTNNAVLQHDMPLPVWGSADPDAKIKVAFAGQTKQGTADSNGRWQIDLDPLDASYDAREMVVTNLATDETQKIKNVIVGEVWICCGQSNMQMETEKIPEVKALIPSMKNIRRFTVKQVASVKEQDRCGGQWKQQNPVSAVAFAFAYFLEQSAGAPIGIVQSSWGSSSIEGWTPRDMVDELPHFKKIMQAFDADAEKLKKIESILTGPKPWGRKNDIFLRRQPNIVYNGMMHPLAPLACRGFVWYQGEANGKTKGSMLQYGKTLPAWIQRYRKEWGRSDMNFLIVMLPGYAKGVKLRNHPDQRSWAWLRESQMKALDLPKTAIANTIDLGLANNIHPQDKLPIGKRLALLAAKETLGQKILDRGPVMRQVQADGERLVVQFDHANGLKTLDGKPPTSFWLASEPEKWVKATAEISGETVVLSSCLLYTSPSPRDQRGSRMPSSA